MNKLLILFFVLTVVVSGCVSQQGTIDQNQTTVKPERCVPTGSDIEGPFYREGAPFRDDIAPSNAKGEKLIITGKVLDSNCEPLEGAIVDIWHTDANGAYDNDSPNFWYRGKVRAKKDGSFKFETYKFETIKPGRYSIGTGFRPAHIHIKAYIPDFKTLTTQIYFSDDPYLAPLDACGVCNSDPNNPEDKTHIIDLTQDENGIWRGEFDIILEAGSKIKQEIKTYK